MLVKFAKLYEDAVTPTRKNRTDAGLDLYSYEDVRIEPHNFYICKTGITLQVPEGYMVRLLPKGKTKFLIGSGVVDSYYEPGEILVRIINPFNYPIYISKGEAICQAVYVKIDVPELEEVDYESLLNNSGRSNSGSIKQEV